MSEYPAINLILGIIGTVTGLGALYLHYREKPNLKVETKKCEHEYTTSTSKLVTLNFTVLFEIKNVGIRGTRITDVGLLFENNPSSEIKKRCFRPFAESRIVNGDDTEYLCALFSINSDKQELDRIECFFKIYHTHGIKKVECASVKKTQKPIMEKLYETEK